MVNIASQLGYVGFAFVIIGLFSIMGGAVLIITAALARL